MICVSGGFQEYTRYCNNSVRAGSGYVRKFPASGARCKCELNSGQSGTRRHLWLPPCHEVGRRECPRPVSRSHDYTATSRSFIIPAMRGGRQHDLSLRGKIAKPLFEEVGRSVAASGLPPKDQDTPESPGSLRISLLPADFINPGSAPHLKPEPRNCF